MSSEQLLIIYLRTPELGKVKTRLASEIGEVGALELYRELLEFSLKVCDRLDMKKQLHFAEKAGFEREGYEIIFQDGESLGDRMRNSFEGAFRSGWSKVLMIGTDCPGIRTDVIQEAFSALDRHDVVFGPAEDGGYYLIGMKSMQPELFSGINWSSSVVMRQSADIARGLKLKTYLLDELYDVDTLEDFKRYRSGH